jgi:aryl-alcohol dehydrogenase-like predicted oxidoreductase
LKLFVSIIILQTVQKIDLNFSQKVEASLKRIGKDRIDILLFHNPPDDLKWKEFDFSKLNELQKDGKVGTFGVSARGIEGAKNVVEAKFGTVLEWVFNIFERRPVNVLFPLIEQNKFNFIARSPLSRGLINSKYLKVPPIFSDEDFRSTLPKEWVDWTINSVKKFHENGIKENEIVEKSILYCLQHKAVTSSIIGIKTQQQLVDILRISASIKNDECLKDNFFDEILPCFPKWA